MGLLLVLCKYNLFGSTVKSSLIPRHLLYSLVNFMIDTVTGCNIDCAGM